MPSHDYSSSIGDEAIKRLRTLSFWRIFVRLFFIILKVKGYSNSDIAGILPVSRKPVIFWQRLFQEGGFDALTTLHYKGQPSQLHEYGEQLALEFDKHPVATLKEAQHRIKEITGLDRSLPQVRAFLQRIKIKPRKVGQIPGKANLEAQKVFKSETLYPLIKQAQQGLIRLLFVDAAHFVHLPFLGYLYSLKRVFIRSAAGRKRFNVLGALDAVTQNITTVCNQAYINAETVCQLLTKLAAQYAGEPIYLILDNARYQKCQLVKSTAASLKIQLVFLEPYSPHLNLIERLWKFVKKKVLYNKYYENFDKFKEAIREIFHKMDNGQFNEELSTLLNPKFQTFELLQTNP